MQNSSSSVESPASLRVVVSQKLNSPNVGYVDQIVGEGGGDIDFGSFTGMLRRTDMDVVHLHRLDSLGGTRRISGKDRIAMALAFAAMIKANRIALVRTLHGRDARGGGGKSAQIANMILNSVTREFVIVDPATRTPRRRSTTLIPFGHYRERFLGYPRGEQVPGRMLCISPILQRRIERPLRGFFDTSTPGLELRLVGAVTANRAPEVARLVAAEPSRVSTRLERISDGTMVAEISEAEVVFIPKVSELDDLHLLLLALSLNRPVLVPDNAVTRDIGADAGPTWVHRFSSPLTGQQIDALFASLRDEPPVGEPHLEGRDIVTTSAMYADVFTRAAARTRR